MEKTKLQNALESKLLSNQKINTECIDLINKTYNTNITSITYELISHNIYKIIIKYKSSSVPITILITINSIDDININGSITIQKYDKLLSDKYDVDKVNEMSEEEESEEEDINGKKLEIITDLYKDIGKCIINKL